MKKFTVVLFALCVVFTAFSAHATFISVSGTLANTGGVPVAINVTDGDSIDIAVATDSLGFYNVVVSTAYDEGSLYLWFQNCNGLSIDTTIAFFPSLPPVTFNADYCPAVGTDSCFAFYHASFDEDANTFFLTVDSVTMANAVAYLWTFGDGEFSNEFFPTHHYATGGLYTVCVNITEADSQTCQYCQTIGTDTNSTSGFSVNVLPFGDLSTKSVSEISGIDVYPNPTDGNTTLRFSAKKPARYIISLHNTSGKEINRQVFYAAVGQNDVPVTIQEASPGIYVLVLSDAQREVTSRVVIRK